MPWLTTVTVVGVVVLAALTWLFIRTRSKDQIEEMMAKRRASSKVVSRAEFLEGPNRIPVVLACTEDRVTYENPDLDAYLENRNIEEIEYDDETSTGHSVHGRVLRLRSHGHVFEFEVDAAAAKQFAAVLPARQVTSGHQQAV
jgi:hypothetical protein